jgi:hypothetical protein
MIKLISNLKISHLYIGGMFLGLAWMNYYFVEQLLYLSMALHNLVVILAGAPLYYWLKNVNRESIPLVPFHGFFYAITFGFAGAYRFNKSEIDMWHFKIENTFFNFSLFCVISSLLMLYLSYFVVAPWLAKYFRSINKFRLDVRCDSTYFWLIFIGYPSSCFLNWHSRQGIMPEMAICLQIIAQFIFYLLMATYFRERISRPLSAVLLGLILPYQLFVESGFLYGSIGQLVVNICAIGIMFFAIKKRIPWLWIGLIIFIISLIQPIKGDLRDRIWQLRSDGLASELRQGTSAVDSIGELKDILNDRYLSKNPIKSESAASDVGGDVRIVARLNLLYPLAWCVLSTPNPQPYRYGSTYLPLFTKWIPRLIWKDKPKEYLGNEWGRRYGLINPDSYSVSFNLPWIAEMYMNFGFAGVLGVSFFIGLLFYFFKVFFCQVENDPARLAFGVLLMCPLMFPESHLSLVLGGVIVGGILLSIMAFCVCKLAPKIIGR